MHAGREWAAVLGGVVAGFVVGWWVGRRGGPDGVAEDTPAIDTGWADRWGERVDAAVDAAADGFRFVERRWRASKVLDTEDIEQALRAVDGGGSMRVDALGGGVVELVGEGTDEGVEAALKAVGRSPGVRVVLNRVWTPSSMHPGQIDAPPGFG
jgi:hypothetical protein